MHNSQIFYGVNVRMECVENYLSELILSLPNYDKSCSSQVSVSKQNINRKANITTKVRYINSKSR